MGAALLVVLQRSWPALEAWIRSEPERLVPRARLVLGATAALCLVPLIGLTVYLWRLGARAMLTEQYPPPGTLVIGGAPVITGAAARRRGRIAQGLALLFSAAAIVLAALVWRLSDLLARP
jgi:hypothetical protein